MPARYLNDYDLAPKMGGPTGDGNARLPILRPLIMRYMKRIRERYPIPADQPRRDGFELISSPDLKG